MKLYSKIFFFLFLLALSIHAFSQAGKPVTVAVSLSPPYSPFLNEYASSGTNRLQVTIIVNDSRMMNYPSKLQMFLQRVNSGVAMRTAEFAAIPPILLNGGNTEIISGASLSPYFMAMNNVFSGFDQSQYTQTGRIPDSQYRIGFRVVDAQRTDVELSNLTFSPPGWYLLNDPPQVNFPLNQSSEKVKDIQQVKFEWFPRHLGSMNPVFAATYQLELFAMRVPGMDINQLALSSLPTYTVTTNQNHFNLMQQHFMLEPGVEYAWRVRAMAADGFTLFQNQGYSEVFSFVYGSLCPVPENIGANVMGTESARVYWDTDPMQTNYEMQIRKQGAENAVWQSNKTTEAGVGIEKMVEAGTTYEYKVKAQCLNTESEFSPLKKFTTRQSEPIDFFNCGKPDNTDDISNFNPKTNLRTGEIIYNGKFPVKLTEIEGSMGTFSGKGRMRVPMLANVQVNMQFTDIKVNELNQVYDGEMVSLYNADSKFFIDDASDYFLEGNQVGNIISGQDSAAIKLNYEVGEAKLTVLINGDNVTINGPGGAAVFTVDDAKNGTTIEDSKGNLYAVDGQGNVTKIGTSAGDVSANDYNTTAAAYNQLSNEWTVTFANSGTWAFDERKSAYADSPFDKEYEKIGDYNVPWKFIPLGKSDKIKASFSKGKIDDHEKLKFLTPTGTEFKSDYRDGEYYMEAIGAKERDGIELYAIYMPDENTKIPVGKLKIASYPKLEFKVKLVPLAENNLNIVEIQNQLNEIYKPYYINWIATLDNVFEDKSWDENNEGLQATGSEFWSEYTDEMRALNAAYEEQRGLDDETLYLFVFPDGNEENNLLGDMPLESRFGYIFNAKESSAKELAATMAHELGHGAFQLKHTFSDKYGIKPSKTQNLMDYNNGLELVKYQWDAIHDPQNRLFNWMQGEGEGEMKKADPNTFIYPARLANAFINEGIHNLKFFNKETEQIATLNPNATVENPYLFNYINGNQIIDLYITYDYLNKFLNNTKVDNNLPEEIMLDNLTFTFNNIEYENPEKLLFKKVVDEALIKLQSKNYGITLKTGKNKAIYYKCSLSIKTTDKYAYFEIKKNDKFLYKLNILSKYRLNVSVNNIKIKENNTTYRVTRISIDEFKLNNIDKSENIDLAKVYVKIFSDERDSIFKKEFAINDLIKVSKENYGEKSNLQRYYLDLNKEDLNVLESNQLTVIVSYSPIEENNNCDLFYCNQYAYLIKNEEWFDDQYDGILGSCDYLSYTTFKPQYCKIINALNDELRGKYEDKPLKYLKDNIKYCSFLGQSFPVHKYFYFYVLKPVENLLKNRASLESKYKSKMWSFTMRAINDPSSNGKLSNHAWGIALDIYPKGNPQILGSSLASFYIKLVTEDFDINESKCQRDGPDGNMNWLQGVKKVREAQYKFLSRVVNNPEFERTNNIAETYVKKTHPDFKWGKNNEDNSSYVLNARYLYIYDYNLNKDNLIIELSSLKDTLQRYIDIIKPPIINESDLVNKADNTQIVNNSNQTSSNYNEVILSPDEKDRIEKLVRLKNVLDMYFCTIVFKNSSQKAIEDIKLLADNLISNISKQRNANLIMPISSLNIFFNEINSFNNSIGSDYKTFGNSLSSSIRSIGFENIMLKEGFYELDDELLNTFMNYHDILKQNNPEIKTLRLYNGAIYGGKIDGMHLEYNTHDDNFEVLKLLLNLPDPNPIDN